MSNHATLIGPFPVLTNNNNKSSNICGDTQDSIHQNGHMSNEIQHSENGVNIVSIIYVYSCFLFNKQIIITQ